MAPHSDPIQRLQRERNIASAGAALLLVAAMAIAVPRQRSFKHELKAANDELLGLQAEVLALQEHTRLEQAEIHRDQDEIRALLHRPP